MSFRRFLIGVGFSLGVELLALDARLTALSALQPALDAVPLTLDARQLALDAIQTNQELTPKYRLPFRLAHLPAAL